MDESIFIEFSGRNEELKQALKFVIANCIEGRADMNWEFAFPHDDNSCTIKVKSVK